jgi:hypothetical protein
MGLVPVPTVVLVQGQVLAVVQEQELELVLLV